MTEGDTLRECSGRYNLLDRNRITRISFSVKWRRREEEKEGEGEEKEGKRGEGRRRRKCSECNPNDLLWIFYGFFLSCVCHAFVCLSICALWSPAGKGLTS